MKRPEQKDYFEFRGDQIIIDYGHADNFMDIQNEYIDQLEKEKRLQELKTLKDAVEVALGNINDLADLLVKAKRGQYKPDIFTCHAILDSITRLRELIKK